MRVAWVAVLALIGCGRFGFDARGDAGAGDGGGGDDGGAPIDLCTATWCWLDPPPLAERTLRAVSGTATDDVWAVGDGGTVRHWDGTAWTVRAFPLADSLTAVVAVAADDVWVAARTGALEHWNGSQWLASATPSGSSAAALARDANGGIWEVGELGTASHDGVAVANVPNAYASTAIYVKSPTDIWVTQLFNAVSHFDGTSWFQSTIGEFPLAVWPSKSATVMWIGGDAISSFDGTSLTPVIAVADVRGMWGATTTDIWAVGDGGNTWHCDGAAWTEHPTATTLELDAVWGASTNDVWAVGEGGTILHYDGTTWRPLGGAPAARSRWFAAYASTDSQLWLGRQDAASAIDRRDDDGTAVTIALPTPTSGVSIEELAGTGPSDVWATDQAGNGVLHWDGAAWATDPTLALATPTALTVAPAEVLVANTAGEVDARTNGSWFQAFTLGTTQWAGVCESPSGAALAVGRYGMSAYRTGPAATWNKVTTPTGRFLQACAFTGELGFAVGGDATIRYTPATKTWANDPTRASTHSVTDVVARGATQAFATANFGTLEMWDGTGWHEEASPSGADLFKLTISPSGTVYAVGFEGTILRRK